MPVCYPSEAGKPYRPSNGTEGEMFMSRFCYRCQHDDDEEEPCPILTMTFAVGIEDADYPREWMYDQAGKPICSAFAPSTGKPETLQRRCEATIDMFDEALKP